MIHDPLTRRDSFPVHARARLRAAFREPQPRARRPADAPELPGGLATPHPRKGENDMLDEIEVTTYAAPLAGGVETLMRNDGPVRLTVAQVAHQAGTEPERLARRIEEKKRRVELKRQREQRQARLDRHRVR